MRQRKGSLEFLSKGKYIYTAELIGIKRKEKKKKKKKREREETLAREIIAISRELTGCAFAKNPSTSIKQPHHIYISRAL